MQYGRSMCESEGMLPRSEMGGTQRPRERGRAEGCGGDRAVGGGGDVDGVVAR